MELINEIFDNCNNSIFKIFISTAAARKDVVRQHRHTEFELSLILSGKGIYKTENGNFDIQEGDIFLYSTNEYHCITDIFPDGDNLYMKLLNIHFSPSYIMGTDSLNRNTEYMNIFFSRKTPFENRIDRTNIYNPKLRELILSVKSECENKEPCYEAIVFARLTEILTLLLRHYNLTENKNVKSLCHIDNISSAITYINEHYNENITLNDITKAAHMHKTSFIANFKAIYNMTTWDYINIKRIEDSLTLLKSTDLTILDIATKCGFNSTANFNKIFKKTTGITPSEYRKK